MTKIMKGLPLADQIKAELTLKVQQYREMGINPKIAILRVGERPDDLAYEERVLKNCDKIGVTVELVHLQSIVSMDECLTTIQKLNLNPEIHGILLFRPLPEHLDSEIIARALDPLKDIDCMGPENSEKIFAGDLSGFAPCTPLAVMAILDFYDYDLSGMNTLVVNRSMVLGKPLAMLLLAQNATVTICHSRTRNLAALTSAADLVITGIGKPEYFNRSFFTEESCIVDVGINFKDGKLCGDVWYDDVVDHCAALTPVPGGIGAVTSVILLKNLLHAVDRQKKTYLLNKEK